MQAYALRVGEWLSDTEKLTGEKAKTISCVQFEINMNNTSEIKMEHTHATAAKLPDFIISVTQCLLVKKKCHALLILTIITKTVSTAGS